MFRQGGAVDRSHRARRQDRGIRTQVRNRDLDQPIAIAALFWCPVSAITCIM